MAKKGFSVFFFFVLFLFCFFSCVICGSAVQCFLNTLPTVVCDVWINSKSVKLWRLIDCLWRNESISVLQSRVMCARGSDWNALCPDFKRKVKKKRLFFSRGEKKTCFWIQWWNVTKYICWGYCTSPLQLEANVLLFTLLLICSFQLLVILQIACCIRAKEAKFLIIVDQG